MVVTNYLWTPKPWKMKVLNPNIWVITPKNAGCGFPWYLLSVVILQGFGVPPCSKKNVAFGHTPVPHLDFLGTAEEMAIRGSQMCRLPGGKECDFLERKSAMLSHSANGPWDKSLFFSFPTKHVTPESLKFSHWLWVVHKICANPCQTNNAISWYMRGKLDLAPSARHNSESSGSPSRLSDRSCSLQRRFPRKGVLQQGPAVYRPSSTECTSSATGRPQMRPLSLEYVSTFCGKKALCERNWIQKHASLCFSFVTHLIRQ